jgi:hypothetical protein
MTMSDAILGLAGLFFLWAQNQGFRRQNDIFAITAGSEPLVPAKEMSGSRLKRYWPLLAMIALVGTQWVWFWMKNHSGPSAPSTDSSAASWVLGFGIGLMVAHTLWTNWADKKAIRSMLASKKTVQTVLPPPSPTPKLVIRRAVYAAGLPAEEAVTDKLNSVARDGIAIKVDATLGGLLPSDPAFGVRKRLEVDYSYGSDAVFHVSRTEPPAGDVMRLVLPEDTEVRRLDNEVKGLNEQIDICRREKIQLNSDLSRAREFYRQFEEQRGAAAEKLKAFTSLQMDALELSAELVEFIKAQGPPPKPEHPREWPQPDDEQDKYMRDRALAVVDRNDKIDSAYRLTFMRRVEAISHRFAIEGFRDESFRVPDVGITEENVVAIANKLWGLAFKVREKEAGIEKG